MSAAEVLLPEDIALEPLQALYNRAGLRTEVDADGDLAVTCGVTCYAIPTEQRDRILLLAFVGTKDDVGRDEKMEFVNRVNNQVSAVRARVSRKEAVVFDYHIPIEGGITGKAIVEATQFFLQATAYAASQCDDADIVR